MDRDKLMRMANSVRTGGKGTVRRKKKAVHKATSTDDKRLQSTLKRLGVNTIPGIEEVNLFQTDGNVVHFVNPKVQASIAANTYVVSGPSQVQSKRSSKLQFRLNQASLWRLEDLSSSAGVQELLPGIMNQIATDVSQIQRFAQSFQANANKGKAVQDADDDDEVPDLVENFEEASK